MVRDCDMIISRLQRCTEESSDESQRRHCEYTAKATKKEERKKMAMWDERFVCVEGGRGGFFGRGGKGLGRVNVMHPAGGEIATSRVKLSKVREVE